MIEAKDTHMENRNGFDNNHPEQCVKSYNGDSTSNTQHLPHRDDSEENPNQDSDKDNMQLDEDKSDKVNPKVSEENNNDNLQNRLDEFLCGIENEGQNLNQDEQQPEVLHAQEEQTQAGNLPNYAWVDEEEKATPKIEKAIDSFEQSLPKLKHQDDVTMSNEKELWKSPKITNDLEMDEQVAKSNEDLDNSKFKNKENQRSIEFLKQLRGFVSNPVPNLKSKFNNIIPTVSNLIGEYKQIKEKGISLANEVVDPLKDDTLQEGILSARFIRLQTEKKGKLSPRIFVPSSVNPSSAVKTRPSKFKSNSNLLKNKTQVSVLSSE